jgi:hypothetical protein
MDGTAERQAKHRGARCGIREKGDSAKRVPSQSTRSGPSISARPVPEGYGVAFASRWEVVIGRSASSGKGNGLERPAATSSPESGSDAGTKEIASSSALISQSAIVLYVPTPQIFGYWQAAACLRAAQKSATYRSPRSTCWQPWCRRSAQRYLEYIRSRSRRHEALHRAPMAPATSQGETIQVQAPQCPCLITSVKTNPTCAVSNTAGTRWKMTASFLLDLLPVRRTASRKSVSRQTGR